MIGINSIYTSLESTDEFRILWISADNTLVYVFNLSENKLPVAVQMTKLQEKFESGELEVLSDDPYINVALEHTLTDKEKSFRNSVWDIMREVVENEPDIYDRSIRGRLLDDLGKRYGVDRKKFYQYLKWYWQRGKTRNAFLPSFSNKGKGVRKSSEKKIGRPSKYGDTSLKNVDEATRDIFASAVKKFYHTRKEHSFKTAYDLMVKEYYAMPVKQPDGTVRNVLLDASKIPTLRQFQYWYSKTYDMTQKLVARKGQATFNLQHRAILGKSDTNIIGPGGQYQIDSTMGDVYLVSQFNRSKIIGRPTIYFVIDVFSRMIVGMYVGLENPSWVAAMTALANAATKKTSFCADYGITIADDDWPCYHIPDTILADRGEMESRSVEALINTLNVRIDNTPAFRADMKGIVESLFRTVNIKTMVHLPGHVNQNASRRGGKDYRLDAILDVRQFTKIIIQCVLNYNNQHLIKGYERTESMITDNVTPIPIGLWKWGIKNRSGQLRTVTEDTIKLCLMPADKALVTAKGIRFKGLHYICERAVSERWFETARVKGSYKVDISYDPRDMSNIYIRNIEGSLFERCFLSDWEQKWRGKSLDELIQQQSEERAMRYHHKNKELQARIDLNTAIEAVVKEAEEMAKQTVIPPTKSGRVAGIRENKASEKAKMRKTEIFSLGDTPKDAANPKPLKYSDPYENHEESTHPITALIKKMAEEDYED